jgi:hypothetical protein
VAGGLARYIQIKAQQIGQRELIEAIGRPVGSYMARERVYAIGAGQALLLDGSRMTGIGRLGTGFHCIDCWR